MIIHLYFNIAKLIYSFFSRRDWKFILSETIGSITIILCAFFFSDKLRSFTLFLIFGNTLQANILFSIFFGGGFVLFSIISRLLCKKDPSEFVYAKSNNTKTVVSVGIIDFSWLMLMGGVYTCILMSQKLPGIVSEIPKGLSEGYYRMYFDEISLLFSRTIDSIFVLGTALAVCMTIIWGGEPWRNKNKQTKNKDKQSEMQYHYNATTKESIKMVIAFFVICIATVLWGILPLYLKLMNIKDTIK